MKNYFISMQANPIPNRNQTAKPSAMPLISCRKILHILLLSILLHSNASAMDTGIAQAKFKVKRANAQHIVFRTEERTYQFQQLAIRYFLFNPLTTIKTPSPGEWRFFYSPAILDSHTIPAGAFSAVSDPGHTGLFQPAAFFNAEQRPSGFYFFSTDRGENVTVIRYDNVIRLEASSLTTYLPPGNIATVSIAAILEPEAPETPILYEIENFNPGQLQIIDNGIIITPNALGIFRASRNIIIRSNTPGEITLHAGILGRESHVNLFILSPPQADNLILKNSNDSNNNHIVDYEEETFPNGPDDPELQKLNILYPAGETHMDLAELLNNPATYEPVNNIPAELSITSSHQLRLYETKNKSVLWLETIVLTPENMAQTLEKLSSIYVEGITASDNEQDATITVTLKRGNAVQGSAIWKFTVLHLYIDRNAPRVTEINQQNIPIPRRARNPSVIPVLTPQEQAAFRPDFTALFELGSARPSLLQRFQNSVEWRVYPTAPAQIGLIPAVEPHPDHHYLANHGTSLQIYGLAPGKVQIGVRLQGSEADYLSFNCPVQTLKSLPVAFQIFPPAEDLPVHARTEGSIPAILHQMNRLVRQAGISFTPVNTQTANFIHETARFRFTLTEEIPGPGSQHVFYTPTPLEQIQGMLYPESKMAYIFPDIYDHEVGETFNKIAGTILRTKAGPQNGTYIAFDSYPMPFFPPAPLPADVALDLGATEYIHRPNGIVICEKTGFHFSTNWPYSMACSSARNILTFNFLNSLETDAEYQIGAAVGIPAPSPLRIDTPEGPVDISFSPTYNKLPCLLDKNLLVACFDTDMIEKNILLHNPVPPAQALVAAALEMLGQKKRGLDGDLEHYNPQLQPQLLQSALQQNIILPLPLPPGAPPNTTPRYILNPIIPPTDHKNASITPDADILDINTLGQRGYKIDPIRTHLIHQHPLLNP